MKKCNLLVTSFAFLCAIILTVGCSKETENEQSPPPGKERHEIVSQSEFNFVFACNLTRLHVDSGGNLLEIAGTVDEFSLGGHQIALQSNEILVEDGGTFIQTENYGKVKFTMNSNAVGTILLTPSQKKQFKAILKR